MTTILGISGLAGSGKDTLADYLRSHGAINVALVGLPHPVT